jgi:nitrite reductase/ring-hydroxylating ferredoxin subunit
MNRKLMALVLFVITVSLVAAGCSGIVSSADSKDNEKSAPGTWITAQVNADQVSIPAKSVDDNTNVHFKVKTEAGELSVMAYRFDDKVFVRSNVCPPCNSIGFTLKNGTLVCDSCGTVFDAATGKGIEGGCVGYPKESIPYTSSNGNITMKLDDVVAAHKQTIEPD